MELRFASTNQALQHLSDITGKKIKIAEKVDMRVYKSSFDDMNTEDIEKQLNALYEQFANKYDEIATEREYGPNQDVQKILRELREHTGSAARKVEYLASLINDLKQ